MWWVIWVGLSMGSEDQGEKFIWVLRSTTFLIQIIRMWQYRPMPNKKFQLQLITKILKQLKQ